MKIMAVDLGDVRTGLAVCDRTEFLASPIGVIHDRNINSVITKVANAVEEYDVGMVVVGHPKNMDGSEGESAKKCENFASALKCIVSVPVILWDERTTTISAHHYLNETDTRGKKRKEVVDAVAATIILENYLEYRKNEKLKNQ